MVHTYIKATNSTISFDIPQNYVGKELELIIFEKKEGLFLDTELKREGHFTVLNVRNDSFKFNRDEANER